jgi:hypothetical protein
MFISCLIFWGSSIGLSRKKQCAYPPPYKLQTLSDVQTQKHGVSDKPEQLSGFFVHAHRGMSYRRPAQCLQLGAPLALEIASADL